MNDLKQILSYEGEITFDKIENILTLFNQRMPETQCPVCKIRMFSIMVECLENSYRHNYDTPDQNPQIKLSLTQSDSHFALSVANRIGNAELKALTNYIDDLNKLSQDELKVLYTKTIHQGHISEKGGAGLGLMKILRSSHEPIKYAIESVDDKSSIINITISLSDIKKH
jgi:hypothetical protein